MNVEFVWDKSRFHEMVASCQSNPTTPYILKYLPKDSPLLEAGCGLGRFVKFLTNLGYDAYGIEISADTVKAAKEIDPQMKIQRARVEEIPFPDDFFGGVICLGVVEHITQGPDKGLQELYRVLKPGGYGIISVPIFNMVRRVKHYLGLSYADYYVRTFYYKLFHKPVSWPKTGIGQSDLVSYHRWPARGDFFEYRFTRPQFFGKLKQAGFEILSEVAMEGLEGLYHELGGVFVNPARPSLPIRAIDSVFSKIPFSHHHTYLAVVRKPS